MCAHQLGRSQDNFLEAVLSFHHFCLGDQTQVIRLSLKCLYPLNPLVGSKCFIWFLWGLINARECLGK